jgi:uncharacterized protein
MADLEEASHLCKACGLCCTGHLFNWTKLRSVELDSLESLGVRVLRSVPSQRGFDQPCPLWQGQCTIYTSESYPHFCRTYKCSLLKKLLDETTTLHQALNLVEQTKALIQDVEVLLPDSPNLNFRERLTAHLESLEDHSGSDRMASMNFRDKAEALLALYENVFGVTDVLETPPES